MNYGNTLRSGVVALTQSLLFVSLLLGFFNSVKANDHAIENAWDLVRSGQAVVIMRHALAPGTGDPSNFKLGDCTTQRNLSEAGRSQAKLIGNVLRSNGVSDISLYSSEWCRCIETAALLGFGTPQPEPILNSFYQDRSTAETQTEALNEKLRLWLNEPNSVNVLVTHQVNISGLTGQYAGSGDMLIVRGVGDTLEVLATISTM